MPMTSHSRRFFLISYQFPTFFSQISGHPRNNLMTENTFLTVERLTDDEVWVPVATDANWETK